MKGLLVSQVLSFWILLPSELTHNLAFLKQIKLKLMDALKFIV